MNYEEFAKRTEMWSYTNIVRFVMENDVWCDSIIRFIADGFQDGDFTLEQLEAFDEENGIQIELNKIADLKNQTRLPMGE